jgi:AcrR family transcriptional regulator
MPRRNGLDTAAVVRAAADLLNCEGTDALTLNRLAGLLGIQSPSLYNHIDGMAGLRRQLALLNARQLADCLSEAAVGRGGLAGVKAVALAYRAYIKDNPGLYLSSLRSSGSQVSPDPDLQAAEERSLRVVLAVLEPLGLGGADAIHAARALRSAVHGFTTLEIAGGFGMPLDLDESFARLVDGLAAGLHPQGAEEWKY